METSHHIIAAFNQVIVAAPHIGLFFEISTQVIEFYELWKLRRLSPEKVSPFKVSVAVIKLVKQIFTLFGVFVGHLPVWNEVLLEVIDFIHRIVG